MRYRLLLFDLDETLYPTNTKLWDAISERMVQYMVDRMDLPADQVHPLRRSYFEKYGTTLRGLQIHHQVDSIEFLEYVHDLPLQEYLNPDPGLRNLLRSLPQRKWICTNANTGHARRVLKALEIDDCFEGIVDICAANFEPKPALSFYLTALTLSGEQDPSVCVLFDDLVRNLEPAKSLGLTTVLVRPGISCDPSANYILSKWQDLPEVFPLLWY
jgi:putative hydrolase of the HAD superfamily